MHLFDTAGDRTPKCHLSSLTLSPLNSVLLFFHHLILFCFCFLPTSVLSAESNMTTSQDLAWLEAELLTEDLVALKRRRSNTRRDATRNERYCTDCAAQTLKDLDIGSIDHHLEKINADILIADLLQDAILAHVKEEDEEKEEDEHHSHHRKMLATRKGLTQQLTAARVHEQVNLAKTSIGAFIVQPTIAGYGVKTTLENLSTQLTDLKALAHPLKDCPELMDTLQAVTRDLTTLREGYDEDNPDRKTSVSKDSRPIGMSKFDRLPRIELPSFNGENVGWRPYWEKFNNALEKDPTLTDVDRLSFLLMTMKCKEGKEIIDSHTRRGPDYDAAVRALKERYDQPRVTSRSTHQFCKTHLEINRRGDWSNHHPHSAYYRNHEGVRRELSGDSLHGHSRASHARRLLPLLDGENS